MPRLCTFSRIPARTTRNKKRKKKKKSGSGMSVPLIWLFCFVVDPVAWVRIHGQFLRALPVKPGMCVRSPTPIGGIVHSTWLSLTHTASCLRGSHEPVLPPRKETFVTHRPMSHNYTVQTQKKQVWLRKQKIQKTDSDLLCFFSASNPHVRRSHKKT